MSRMPSVSAWCANRGPDRLYERPDVRVRRQREERDDAPLSRLDGLDLPTSRSLRGRVIRRQRLAWITEKHPFDRRRMLPNRGVVLMQLPEEYRQRVTER